LKQRFKLSTPEEFWLTTGRTYTHLYSLAMKMLLKFPTSYLCEKGFSTMLFLENKFRARLDVEHDKRIKLANDVYVKTLKLSWIPTQKK
jgi:zinc finger BED domain-containing protein 5/7/8/9